MTDFKRMHGVPPRIRKMLADLDSSELDTLDGISSTEMGYIDGVTAGQGLISKALVLDSDGNIIGIKDMDVSGNITGDGALALDGSGYFGSNLNVGGALAVTGAISGAAITGTSFVIGSADISETELETIDGVTAGTVTAAKVCVPDASGTLKYGLEQLRQIDASGNYRYLALDVCGNATWDLA